MPSDAHKIISLETDSVRIAILPELGAKIISLVSKQTGREWISRSGKIPPFPRVALGAKFEDGPVCGADECIPTVAPCRFNNLDLPDHGEAWTQPWTVVKDGRSDHRVSMRLRLPITPLEIERTIEINGPDVRFDYRLTNLSDDTINYLWAFHPLLTIEAGDVILLPESCRQIQTEVALGGCPLGERGDRWNWPKPHPEIDLARMELGGGMRAVKLFTPPLIEGFAAIRNAISREMLTFRFNRTDLPHLGIWINRGAWNGYHHVALEPTNAAADRLDVAANEPGNNCRLGPRATMSWDFTMTVGCST